MTRTTAPEAVELTARQSRFVDEYLIDLNATQAAIRSGEFTEREPSSGYYVYLLANPETGHVFYVGKGIRRRAKQHAKNARAGHVDNVRKYQAISEVHSAGNEVQILYCPAGSERDAYRFERHLIFRLIDHGITNQVSGTTPMQERVAARAKHNLETMKTRERWKRELDAETEARIIRVFGTLDACYDRILNGFTELSKIAD